MVREVSGPEERGAGEGQQAGPGVSVCVQRGWLSKEVLVGRLCVLSELGFSTPRAATVLEWDLCLRKLLNSLQDKAHGFKTPKDV